MSMDEKRAKMMALFYEKKEFLLLKDVKKIAAKYRLKTLYDKN